MLVSRSYNQHSQPIVSSSSHQRLRARVRDGAPSAGIEPAADPPESIETAVDKLLMLSARADGARRPQGDVACMPLAASASRTRGSAAAVRRQDPAAE